jgi:hypothetical protein
MDMRMDYYQEPSTPPPKEPSGKLRQIIRIIAIVLVVVSIILIIYGLIPYEKVSNNRTLQGGLSCSSGIDVDEGDILVIDFEVDGPDVDFYLTFEQPYNEDNQEYIEKVEHATNEHLEVNIKKSGFYYFNFGCDQPSSSNGFIVDLNYKILGRYSLVYILLGVIFLAIGLVLTMLQHFLKKGPLLSDQDQYIRI